MNTLIQEIYFVFPYSIIISKNQNFFNIFFKVNCMNFNKVLLLSETSPDTFLNIIKRFEYNNDGILGTGKSEDTVGNSRLKNICNSLYKEYANNGIFYCDKNTQIDKETFKNRLLELLDDRSKVNQKFSVTLKKSLFGDANTNSKGLLNWL